MHVSIPRRITLPATQEGVIRRLGSFLVTIQVDLTEGWGVPATRDVELEAYFDLRSRQSAAPLRRQSEPNSPSRRLPMNTRHRIASALALWLAVLATACDSNRTPTAPALPEGNSEPSSVLYTGTLQALRMDSPAVDPAVTCIIRNVNAATGQRWSFSLTLPQGASAATARQATWASDFLATSRFTPANYALSSSHLELFGFTDGSLDRFGEGCNSSNTRIRFGLPVLFTLPSPQGDSLQGAGTLKLNLTVARWSADGFGYGPGFFQEFAGHAEVPVQFDLRRH